VVRKIKPSKEERKAAAPAPDAPDEFLSVSQRVFDWMADNSKVVMGVLGVALAAGIIYGATNSYAEHVSSKASLLLGEVLEIQTAQVDLTGTATPEPGERTFASEEEKSQALREAALALIEAHPKHDAGNAGRLYLGRACLDMGDLECASQAYQGYLDNTSEDDPLRTVALLGLGAAMEQKPDLAQAFAAYSRIADGRTAFTKDLGLLHTARTLIAQGDKDKARGYLERIETDFPDSPFKGEASTLLETLQ